MMAVVCKTQTTRFCFHYKAPVDISVSRYKSAVCYCMSCSNECKISETACIHHLKSKNTVIII